MIDISTNSLIRYDFFKDIGHKKRDKISYPSFCDHFMIIALYNASYSSNISTHLTLKPLQRGTVLVFFSFSQTYAIMAPVAISYTG